MQDALANVGVGDLTAAKEDRRFDLVALLEEAHRMVLLELVIVLVGVRPEFDFLDLDPMLLLLRFVLLLLLQVGVLPVVDDLGDGGLGGWRHEH